MAKFFQIAKITIAPWGARMQIFALLYVELFSYSIYGTGKNEAIKPPNPITL
jgi:hypothetical protein